MSAKKLPRYRKNNMGIEEEYDYTIISSCSNCYYSQYTDIDVRKSLKKGVATCLKSYKIFFVHELESQDPPLWCELQDATIPDLIIYLLKSR